MSIRINATVMEARKAAGHNKEQWDRFYFITKDEAKRLSEAHPEWTKWIEIHANVKDDILARVNQRLVAEGIPAVEMIILKWRLSQLMRDIQRKYAEGSMLVGMTASSTGSQTQVQAQPGSSMQQSPNTQQSEHSPSEALPYDPIRDL
ncbi:hypothetical protein P154DRAFT_525768 [Amniculicola lignicola CBS 123094]|uniref:Uncharacterized protein n=1 Tax=Amniculicola lignicola CBS 123094 TaxID=1392246 RepID=A0A6A5W2S9_9PLEO|nr:hypothetical protein P154DRAFT_525768 [Amniculicola lignicola CBS 123094]